MRENFKEIPLLQQREIEAKAMGPLIRAFCREFGEERTYEVVRRTLKEVSRQAGKELSERCGGGLDSLRKNCISRWGEGGAQKSPPKEDSADCCSFDVTYCAFAEIYRELGYGDIGTIISCERDEAFLNGFDENLELIRSKTLMEGGDCCDFCYRRKK
ncbi:MAG: L-2-amino-thiazoline-4-carboxylic acid hydrolase [Synergistaceae bacterium]|nr:L-2-amino-thiazoline-4-carboxylic acid hydrolase [Synergistaceae bacterium]